MRNEDRRNTYTEMVIRNAVFELLEAKPIEKISVTEVCKIAGINRSTFYLHYMDCYHVLEKSQDDFCDKLIGYMEAQKNVNNVDTILDLHKLIREDHDLYLILIRSKDPMHAFHKFTDYCKKYMAGLFKETYDFREDELDWICHYIISGSFAISSRYAHESVDNLERENFLHNFITGGLQAVSHKNNA